MLETKRNDFESLGLHLPAVSLPERSHDDHHVLIWQARGQGTDLVLAGDAAFLPVAYAAWIPAGVRHRIQVREDSVLLPLFFDCDKTATTLRNPTIFPVDKGLQTLFLAYLQASNSIIQPRANITRVLLGRIEKGTAARVEVTMPTSPAALQIAKGLQVNPGDERSVDALSHSVHASRRTIERAFRAETGLTPQEWRLTLRMKVAADLLLGGDSPAAVATRVGYSHVNAFRRVFRTTYGVTPTVYVAQRRRA